MTEAASTSVVVLPDAGPLITLAYADALDLLLAPGWPVRIVDMVLHEVTRTETPSSDRIRRWTDRHAQAIVNTRTYERYRSALADANAPVRRADLGELAIQESINDLAITSPQTAGVFLFEDHKIARASFLVPANCRKVSTRAWLLFLEGRGLIGSAAAIERAAVANGREFSRLRFPR